MSSFIHPLSRNHLSFNNTHGFLTGVSSIPKTVLAFSLIPYRRRSCLFLTPRPLSLTARLTATVLDAPHLCTAQLPRLPSYHNTSHHRHFMSTARRHCSALAAPQTGPDQTASELQFLSVSLPRAHESISQSVTKLCGRRFSGTQRKAAIIKMRR